MRVLLCVYLREHEHPMSSFLQFLHHLLQQRQFPRSLCESAALIHSVRNLWRLLQPIKTPIYLDTRPQNERPYPNKYGTARYESVKMVGSYHRSSGEELGVVAAFLEVHHHVEQRDLVPSSAGV